MFSAAAASAKPLLPSRATAYSNTHRQTAWQAELTFIHIDNSIVDCEESTPPLRACGFLSDIFSQTFENI